MEIEVFLTSAKFSEADVKDKTVVVIDVLRACSTICTALHNGARTLIPVADMAEAGKMAANLDPSVSLLAGERGGEKIQGYHLGNSPLEYTPEVVGDKVVVLNTTNGTGAICQSRGAAHLLIGCFLNAERVVDFVRNAGNDLFIVCSGWMNRVSLEDTLCAGLFLHRIWEGREPASATDAAHIAFTLYQHERDDIPGAIRRSNHAQRLVNLGYDLDVDYCSRVDALPILPVYRDNRLVAHTEGDERPARAAARIGNR